MKRSKVWLSILSFLGLSVFCCCGTGIGFFYRYFTAGVNPLREVKLATLGESIQVKDDPFDGRNNALRRLLIDEIDHGSQFQPGNKKDLGPRPVVDWTRIPTTYYHPNGPVGLAMAKFNWFPFDDNSLEPGDARMPASLVGFSLLAVINSPLCMLPALWSEPPVGVVMMNNGTPAAYARPYQFVDFYERDPSIIRLSLPNDGKAPSFTHIADAKKRGAQIRVLEGNERKTLENDGPKAFYHLLVVDTSHGHPALPSKELLTKEGMQSLMNSVVDDGIILFHTSSRNFALEKVVASSSSQLKFAHLRMHDGKSDRQVGHYTSEWVAVARNAEALRFVKELVDLRNQRNPGPNPNEILRAEQSPIDPALFWTDGGSNSLKAVQR